MTMLAFKPQTETTSPVSDRVSVAGLYPKTVYPNSAEPANTSNGQASTAKPRPGYRYPLLHPSLSLSLSLNRDRDRDRIAEPDRPYHDFQQLKFTAVTTVAREHAKHISTSIKQGSSKPCLQLSGNWLGKAGFGEDTRCLVEVYKGMLVVTPDE